MPDDPVLQRLHITAHVTQDVRMLNNQEYTCTQL